MRDSLDPIDEDIVAVLAMFRSRMEQSLNYSGIQVIWDVRDAPHKRSWPGEGIKSNAHPA